MQARFSYQRLLLAIAGAAALICAAVCSPAVAANTDATPSQVFCADAVNEYVNQVFHVESRTDMVKSYAQYKTLVAEANDVQAHVPWTKTTGVCLTGIAIPARKALNLYNDVASKWIACTADNTCDSASVTALRLKSWATASKYIRSAYNRLD